MSASLLTATFQVHQRDLHLLFLYALKHCAQVVLVLTYNNTIITVEQVRGNFILYLLKKFIILIIATAAVSVNLV